MGNGAADASRRKKPSTAGSGVGKKNAIHPGGLFQEGPPPKCLRSLKTIKGVLSLKNDTEPRGTPKRTSQKGLFCGGTPLDSGCVGFFGRVPLFTGSRRDTDSPNSFILRQPISSCWNKGHPKHGRLHFGFPASFHKRSRQKAYILSPLQVELFLLGCHSLFFFFVFSGASRMNSRFPT